MKEKKKGFTLIELMIVVAIIGILAAIAIPNFLRFQARSKQSEAKQNLGSIYTAYTSYFSDNNTYPDANITAGLALPDGSTVNCFSIADWQPKGQNRYAYECNDYLAFPNLQGTALTACTQTTAATATGFTVAACGNVDNDNYLDEWYENDQKVQNNQCNDIRSDDTQTCADHP
jgi:type IV pilus assembly protein PilA